MDPLESARALLVLTRLVYRARAHAAARGVLPAPAARDHVAKLGRELAAQVERAERAEGDERAAALEAVARLGEQLSQSIQEWESVQGLIGVTIDAVRGRKPLSGGPPPRMGQ